MEGTEQTGLIVARTLLASRGSFVQTVLKNAMSQIIVQINGSLTEMTPNARTRTLAKSFVVSTDPSLVRYFRCIGRQKAN